MTTDYTEEEIGKAYIFLSDIKGNQILRDKWNKILDQVKDKSIDPKKKLDYIDNFLSEQGYDTSAGAVLHVLKLPWWNDYIKSTKSNAASDKFVQQILQDPSLYARWAKVISESLKAGSFAKANDLLKYLGYNCTAEQVDASFKKMRAHNLNFWTGIYGKTILKTGDQVVAGPTLVIYGDSSMSIGSDTIFGWEYKDGRLSWSIQPKDKQKYPFPNPHKGSITFSTIAQPKKEDDYVGPIFSGYIDYPTGNGASSESKIYSGELGEMPKQQPSGGKAPHRATKEATGIEKIAHELSPFIQIGFAISLIAGAVHFGYKAVSNLRDRLRTKTSQERLDKAQKELEDASEDLNKLEKSGASETKIAKAKQRVADAQKELKEARENRDSVEDIKKSTEDAEKQLDDTTDNLEQSSQELTDSEPLSESLQTRTESEQILDDLQQQMENSPSPEERTQIEQEVAEQEQAIEEEQAEAEASEDEGIDEMGEEGEFAEVLEEL